MAVGTVHGLIADERQGSLGSGRSGDLSAVWWMVPVSSLAATCALRWTSLSPALGVPIALGLFAANACTALLAGIVLVGNRGAWRAWQLLLLSLFVCVRQDWP